MIAILFSTFLLAYTTAASLEPCDVPGELKPDPDHCDRFFQCTESGWQSMKCKPKTLFNPKILVCDWAKNVKCTKKFFLAKEADLEPCDEPGKLKADPDHCDRFFQCTESGWQSMKCKPKTLFNPKILVCDWAKNVKCNKKSLFSKKDDLEPCDNVGQLKPDTEYCNRFYQCTNNGWASLYCQPPTLFNPKILNCDWPANVECAKSSRLLQALDPCDTVGELKPDPVNCDRFYQCTNNGWASLQCEPPTLFNKKILNCDWPKNVVC